MVGVVLGLAILSLLAGILVKFPLEVIQQAINDTMLNPSII
jgi:hypothetical protein